MEVLRNTYVVEYKASDSNAVYRGQTRVTAANEQHASEKVIKEIKHRLGHGSKAEVTNVAEA